MKQKSLLKSLWILVALTFALFSHIQTALAYDFSAVSPSGQTLYYTIITGTNDYRVYVTFPNTSDAPWDGYQKPTGALTVPSYVVNGIISYTVKYVCSNAFKGCTGLTSVTIENSSTTIGNGAFSGCTNLTQVSIPYSVTAIGTDAFLNCYSLFTVDINSNIIVSNNYAYNNATNDYGNLKTFFGNQVVQYIIGPNVNSIGKNAFRGCSGMQALFLSSGVNSISENAFRDCSSLTSVDFPNYITHIDDNAFYNCSSLTNLFIPDEVTSIGSCAFWGCYSLTSVAIPSSVNNIGNFAFGSCFSLTSVTINSNAIASASYSEMYSMKNKFGDQVTRYTIGSNITSIGQNAFYGCSDMAELVLPSSLTSIGSSAFYNCSGLNWVKISDLNAWYIIDFANAYANPLYYANHFYVNTNEVVNLTVTSNISEIKDYTFVGYIGLHSVNIGNSVTSIGEQAFKNCTGLTSATIGGLVYSIGDEAFRNCNSLTSITIPNNVASIGENAFKDCSSLTSVTLNNSAIASATYTSKQPEKHLRRPSP